MLRFLHWHSIAHLLCAQSRWLLASASGAGVRMWTHRERVRHVSSGTQVSPPPQRQAQVCEASSLGQSREAHPWVTLRWPFGLGHAVATCSWGVPASWLWLQPRSLQRALLRHPSHTAPSEGLGRNGPVKGLQSRHRARPASSSRLPGEQGQGGGLCPKPGWWVERVLGRVRVRGPRGEPRIQSTVRGGLRTGSDTQSGLGPRARSFLWVLFEFAPFKHNT